MPLDLVPRSARVFSAHLNRYYRVLKGVDPETLAIRLLSGGSFQIRNSVTNAPVFTVTDMGITGSLAGGSIVPGTVDTAQLHDDAVTSAKIAPQTIQGGLTGDIGLSTITTENIAPNTILGNAAGANSDIAAQTITGGPAGNILAGTIVNADVNAAAAIAYSKLNLASSITSGDIADGTIVNADVNAAAAIAYSKLNLASSITSGDIADGTIVNADVNAAAAIALAKLAHVGSGNVLKSNGSANVGGQIVNADVAVGANIDGAKLADNSITSAKLTGASVPAGSITTTEIANGTILDADVNGAAAIAGSKLATSGVTALQIGALPVAIVYHSASQSIGNNTNTVVAFDSETLDNDTIHSTSTNTSRLTCKTAGVYILVGQVQWVSNPTSYRQVFIKYNGTTGIAENTIGANSAGATTQTIVMVASLAVNDYVELWVAQGSGGSLNVQGGGGRAGPWFAAIWTGK